MRSLICCACLLAVLASPALAQDPYPGLTIISLRTSTESFLIDMDGNPVKTWHGAEVPTEFAYMLPDSSVLRPCRDPEGNGRGGRIQRIDVNDNVIWDYYFSDPNFLQHHDIQPMPGGNVLIVAWERRTLEEAIQAGRQIVDDSVQSTYLAEVEPVGFDGGNVVWEWRAWDHLVQDADPTKDNYGVVADHPELLDINWGDVATGNWLHANAIDYDEEHDQIVFSARNTSEVYVLDHSTTTEEAAGHTGGSRGRGGDLLYRWGNPQVYHRGAAADQVSFGTHGAIWIDPGLPGAGDIMLFNNGNGADPELSSVEQITPPRGPGGEFLIEPGEPYGPVAATWRYGDVPGFFSRFLSGAYRMPNGNTVICEGQEGRIFEVLTDGTIVWVYLAGGPVHRAPRYWETPTSAPLELPTAVSLRGNHPNPFNPATTVVFDLERAGRVTVEVLGVDGRRVRLLADRIHTAGMHSVVWHGCDDAGRSVPSGTYLLRLTAAGGEDSRKMTLVR